ncbi:hypothetical protein [Singulisphaera sp. PoT]|uniref:hypothetical protein n=1 Tax=Singulisphaera sp. PoT TaxID=3411797 RepID=UPI003BF4AF40
MNDLSSLTGQAKRLTVGGEVFDLHPLTIDDFGKLQEWVDRQYPDPFDLVNKQISAGRVTLDDDGKEKREEYNVTQQQFLFRIAMEQSSNCKHLIGRPDADALLSTLEGVKQLLLLSIRKSRPDFTDEDADRLYRRMTIGDVARVYQATNADMVMGSERPKAPTPSGKQDRPKRSRKTNGTGGRSSTRR